MVDDPVINLPSSFGVSLICIGEPSQICLGPNQTSSGSAILDQAS